MLIRGWFYGLAGILYSYATTLFCGWRVYSMVSHTTLNHVSDRNKAIQRQLTLTIALQAACPLIVTGGALIFLYIGIKIEFHKEDSFSILFYSFMVFPVLNPLVSFVFISAYRRGLINLWRRILGCGPVLSGWKDTVVTVSTF
jgi:hypothetical protein